MSLPYGWRIMPLSDVVGLQRGFDLPNHARRPGPYPVLTSGETGGFHDEGPVKGPGITIGRATNLGQPKWSDGDFWPHNTTMFVKDFKGNVPRWVYHVFKNTDLVGYDSGSVQPMLNRNYIAAVPIVVPPHPEQQAIAEVLGALDDKIAANLAAEASADALVDALYKGAVSRGGAREVPLLDAFTVEFGEAFKGASFSEPGVGRPLIRIRDLKTFVSQVWTTEVMPREVVIQPGDVVVGMDAEFRPTWWLGAPGLMNQRVLRASANVGSAFVRQALVAPLRRIEGYKTGTTVIHLNKSDLDREHVIWPSQDALLEFGERALVVLAKRVASATERRQLAVTRDALLPGLMSGKIRVKDAESAVEEVV